MIEKTVRVSLGNRSYDILIGHDNLVFLGEKIRAVVSADKVAVITNSVVKRLYADTVISSLKQAQFKPFLIEIPDGEEYKSLDVVSKVYDELIFQKIHRTDLIVALGGGVIGD
ncbi:MAG: 3-dehydroquinate synthase, partial [Candidatus Subteraquimicrobiales bacterium]|nr:3-dehydroquinate synthase [Candidatus Subteraquimicrobiales bacterium]